LNISDEGKIHGILETLPQTQFWINCAAYTKVDDAETHRDEAQLYNAIAPGYIAKACQPRGVHLFHFSSDYVYHNALRRPLLETDPTEPKGIYAITKLEGEQQIMELTEAFTIIRTSWVYGPGGHNFVNTMLRLGKIKEQVNVVSDQVGAPTLTTDIAECCKELIQLHASGSSARIRGVFNYANLGEVTWDNFARAIFQKSNLPCQINSITTAEYGAPAPRPAYSVLNCSKISSLLPSQIPTWENALTRYLDSIH
jgi:dTDP-4-dehydrorhamnose reductase